MKKRLIFIILAVASCMPLAAYTSTNIAGQTGLIATPTARINFEGEGSGDVAASVGYNYANNGTGYSTPRVNVALFDRWELGGAYNSANNENDFLLHTKLRFSPWSGKGNSALAVGGTYQNMGTNPSLTAGQFYLAATYTAQFFGMEADTSIVLGKTFGTYVPTGNLDFSMGFDLNLFPSIFNGYVRWLNELSNYDFIYRNAPTAAYYRGAFNTGIRIPILKHMEKMKFDVSFIVTDALDNERGFALNASFGTRF
ncbi:MAG: hypothetical protein JSR44_00440 [Spirochaetes bacterium]|nr:hypothetical protein [Spirochaetota bacterium]